MVLSREVDDKVLMKNIKRRDWLAGSGQKAGFSHMPGGV
jgi:hypothetical protein